MEALRITAAVALMLRCFLDDVDRPRYGYELMTLTGFPSGKLYPILARLEKAGWIRRTQGPTLTGSGPARVHYRLVPEAVPVARQEVAALSAALGGSPNRGARRARLAPDSP